MTRLRNHLNDRRPHWLYRFECDGQSTLAASDERTRIAS